MIQEVLNAVTNYIQLNYIKVTIALVTLVVGIIVITWVKRALKKFFDRVEYDVTLEVLIQKTIGVFLWVILFIVILSNLGFNVSGFITGLGVTGIVIGFATKDIFSNFAAGLLILGTRPFKVGGNITAGGITGVVKEINLSHCVLISEKQRVIVPNVKIWGGPIKNNK